MVAHMGEMGPLRRAVGATACAKLVAPERSIGLTYVSVSPKPLDLVAGTPMIKWEVDDDLGRHYPS